MAVGGAFSLCLSVSLSCLDSEGGCILGLCVCPLSLRFAVCRDSDAVYIVCVFQSSLFPLLPTHDSESLCLTETQTDK